MITSFRNKVQAIYRRHERHIMPLAFLVGFIFDNLTLRRIDLWLENLILIVYLGLCAMSIALFALYRAGRVQNRFFNRYAIWLPVLMQFAFGNLFSGFVVFYSRSGSLIASWPFLLFLVFFFIGNELFKDYYLRIGFQVSMFFIVLFSYAIFSVPVVLGTMGVGVFLFSGFLSLGAIALLLYGLWHFIPTQIEARKYVFFWSIGGIFLLFNILYFTNIIPPIPLSLKDSGIYHNVVRVGEGYRVVYEPAPWYVFFHDYRRTYHRLEGERVYAFSAVFAPTKLNTTIFHRWSYYDEDLERWVAVDRIRFPITGGRDGGWRGYSFKRNVFPGKWRVDIVTARDQLIGRMQFRIIEVDEAPVLRQEVI